jgi:tryptophan synthase alpha chain
MSQSPAQRLTQSIRDARDTRPALVSFLTAGYPSREHFRADLATVADHSDVVEIGVPFTDPMADGVSRFPETFWLLAFGF